jgi:hypothetical protein
MRPVIALVAGLGVLAVGGVALAASQDDEPRRIWLIKGTRYAIVHRIAGAGWDASMYPGFCNFSQPVITGQGTENPQGVAYNYTEVQFMADWCITNLQWDVPDNVAINEVDGQAQAMRAIANISPP